MRIAQDRRSIVRSVAGGIAVTAAAAGLVAAGAGTASAAPQEVYTKTFTVKYHPTPQAAVLAHQWLEQTYEALGAEPVRASGKVLLLDRILAIAMAAGYQGLSEDPDLAEAYARHTAAAVGRARVIVDVAGLTVGY